MLKNYSSRIDFLDSLRGLASLQVLIHHCLCMSISLYSLIDGTSILQTASNGYRLFVFSPLHIFWAGHEAVIFFFVMSGFVLSIPYFKGRNSSFKSYIIKRLFRIYIPYLVILTLGILINRELINYTRIEQLSNWFNDFYSQPIKQSDIWSFVFYLKGNFHNISTSLWSLPVEIKLSTIFPLFCFLIKNLSLKQTIALPFVNMFIYHIGKKLGIQEIQPEFALLYFFSFFLFGALLSKCYGNVVAFVSKLTAFNVALVLICITLLYTYEWNIQNLPLNIYSIFSKFPSDYAVMIASMLLISIGSNKNVSTLLSKKVLIYLGKISFSLYLIHPLIIGILGFSIGGDLAVPLLLTLCGILSIALAIPFHVYIEEPIQKLGRKIATRVDSVIG